ncbi:MAG: HAD family hydrolase [Candidatus Cloacimonetes bacterium]|nr:HAD family hydrolase [Candidatus Cloacimonadota bacterium]MCF7814575.1 HAD family hydrolase [Candidatus Cloacimonadota bacterium]MCF7869089.1 HAD family hydrolase [Candidatus Cloacimonadota bacterium]MCF7884506.1 HAD family hydrolase [Candidatus Cloacimonadota bacterium]
MKKENLEIVFTDLDRTLLRDDNTFSSRSLKALKLLKKTGIKVVIATGRNIFSAEKVLPHGLPIDYLMISSGCGIIDWKTKKVVYENHLSQIETDQILRIFDKYKLDFMIHHPIPENHRFSYFRSRNDNLDFERRLEIYSDFAEELTEKPQIASQFIAIFKPDELKLYENVKNEINSLQVIRATSPLDHESIWLEVFPNEVSKGHSAKWLCKKLEICRNSTIGIGNDFNDIDLLDFTGRSFVVENAPKELKEIYQVIDSNQGDGFAKLIEKVLKES